MIGLIGGLGPAATVHYDQGLLAEAARRDIPLRLLIAHADVTRVLALAECDDRTSLTAYLAGLAAELERGGARVLAIGAVTPHLVAEDLARAAPIPLVDLVAAVQDEVRRRGFRRVALMGTKMVTESRLFGRLAEAAPRPEPDRAARVHEAYVSIVHQGRVDEQAAARLSALASELVAADGADALVLAGTELALAPAETWGDIPVIDSAALHIRAIVDAVRMNAHHRRT